MNLCSTCGKENDESDEFKTCSKCRKRRHDWSIKKPEKARESSVKYQTTNAEKINGRNRIRYKKNRERERERSRRARQQERTILLNYDSTTEIPSCECCGENYREFLSIDHVGGNGAEHKREEKIGIKITFYRWLIKNNFPEGFRVLCHNCNQSLGHYGYCPHQKSTPYEVNQDG